MTFFARPVLAAAVLACVGLLVAGCGGGKPGASVASLGTTTTGGTDTTANATGGAPSGGGAAESGGGSRSGGELRMAGGSVHAMTKFAACMRKNGEPTFPDSNGQGQISISSAAGIDPGSTQFQHAQQACQKELPNGGVPSPAQQAQARQGALAFSACMRKNGVPNFPDPQFGPGGRVSIRIHAAGSGPGLDPNSPQFQHAQQVCQKDLPFGKGGPAAKAGG
jgi:hypothetical protein